MLETLDLNARPSSLVSNFEAVRDLLRTYGPDSLQEMRERAFKEFNKFGIPTSKDEEFKYISLKVLEEGKFGPAYGATVDRFQLGQTVLGKVDAITVTFLNGEAAIELSSHDALPDGVFVGTLRDGSLVHEETLMRNLGHAATLEGRLGSTNDERFVHLNTAYLGEGAFIYIPSGVDLERPIHVQWLSTEDHGPFVTHPRNLIVLEAGASAKVVESYAGMQGVYFTNAVTEAILGKDAILELTRVQNETSDAVHISTTAVHQAAGSTVTSNNVSFGGKVVRNDVNVWLDGEHTETWLNGVSVGTGNQVIDNHTRIDHAKPNCHSFETYKAVLGDHASGVFNGKIFVYEDAQKTDAKQTNQAMLLSPTAGINTKPQLEIFADDVRCTHGATIGQLREDALFYLRTRGIPDKQAEALLVYAFAAEVLEKISVPEVRDALESQLFSKLDTQSLPQEVR
ncbi:MAG TPA: Fe-S cluster assembly protein SufD [Fimbriimonas sp.]|nr:Fe-S cluster assembly protein SufD [Fimbriimonas sp.]